MVVDELSRHCPVQMTDDRCVAAQLHAGLGQVSVIPPQVGGTEERIYRRTRLL